MKVILDPSIAGKMTLIELLEQIQHNEKIALGFESNPSIGHMMFPRAQEMRAANTFLIDMYCDRLVILANKSFTNPIDRQIFLNLCLQSV